MEALEFDPTRWAFYLTAGPIALTAYFFVGSRALKVTALLAALIFLEGVALSWRSFYFIGFSLSSAVSYVLLASLFLDPQSRRQMEASSLAWMGFLFFAFMGAIIGGFVPGVGFGENLVMFQMFYLEGLVYFWIGRAAFRSSEELLRVLNMLFIFGGFVAVLHLFSITTGYRFYAAAGKEFHEYSQVAFRYGAVFSNPNTLAYFYSMVLPAAIISTLGWARPRATMLPAILVSMVLMGVSLVLTASRGGVATTALTTMIAFALLPFGLRGFLGLAATGLFTGSFAVVLLFFAFPDLLDATLGRFVNEGLSSLRYEVWAETLRILARNPLGIGLHSGGYLEALRPAGILLANPHSIYLGLAVNTGIPGLAFFMTILVTALRRANLARRVLDPQGRTVASIIFLMVLAFLIGGLAEPIYGNGIKLQHFFWILVGIASYLPVLVTSSANNEASLNVQRKTDTDDSLAETWGGLQPKKGSPL